MFLHVNIKVFQNLMASIFHAFVYLNLHISLKTIECFIDFFFSSTLLIDFPNASFKVDSVCLTKNFIRSAEYIIKKIEFLVKDIEYTHICVIPDIYEVDNNNIMFLTITVATTNALFNSLRIPR